MGWGYNISFVLGFVIVLFLYSTFLYVILFQILRDSDKKVICVSVIATKHLIRFNHNFEFRFLCGSVVLDQNFKNRFKNGSHFKYL